MSQPEIDRFVRDLATDKELMAEIRGAAGMEGAVDLARGRGYAFTRDELASFLKRSLTEQQLDSISGGQNESIEVIDAQRRVLDALKGHEP